MGQDELFPAEKLIPHRQVMSLLEWVKRPVDKTLQTESTVKAGWPLQRNGMVSSVICVELVAQAIAALRTWCNGQGTLARLGFVVGIKEAEFSASSIAVGTRLFVDIAESYNFGEYAVYEGHVRAEPDFSGKVIIQAMEPEEKALNDLLSR